MKVGVVTFPGSLDDRDALRAVRLAGGEPVPLWHGDHDLAGVDALDGKGGNTGEHPPQAKPPRRPPGDAA